MGKASGGQISKELCFWLCLDPSEGYRTASALMQSIWSNRTQGTHEAGIYKSIIFVSMSKTKGRDSDCRISWKNRVVPRIDEIRWGSKEFKRLLVWIANQLRDTQRGKGLICCAGSMEYNTKAESRSKSNNSGIHLAYSWPPIGQNPSRADVDART